jgi:hypothetical protein
LRIGTGMTDASGNGVAEGNGRWPGFLEQH